MLYLGCGIFYQGSWVSSACAAEGSWSMTRGGMIVVTVDWRMGGWKGK